MPTSQSPAVSDLPDGTFQCPLRGRCFDSVERPFPSARALNAAVAEWQSCPAGGAKEQQAERLFRRCLPVVAKALIRFCPISRCYPGECLAEELLGATYVIFVSALDDYRPTHGTDFLGYATQRLHWGLRHEARRLRKARPPTPPSGRTDGSLQPGAEETRILDRVVVAEILDGLAKADAALLELRYRGGYSNRELAQMSGVSCTALRKRLERLRARLRGAQRPEPSASST